MNLLDLMVKIGVDDKATSKIEGIAGGIKDKVGSAFATVGKLAAGVGVAAGGAAVAIGTAATQSFASYEQLAGGVEKLYGDASDKVKQYAMQGARTSGMSMNEYMQQATSFSAALINSLGGDVDKAADQTDKAMRLMSDNVNTFGTDAESVQNAIQGLSRENYTMLDNLKLGYAGTKEGMQQLIDDANAYAKEQGINADLTMGNFSDMIDAIDLIQQKQRIWGTTSKEALTTIEGSIGMVKASWQNLLTAFGSGDENQIRESISGIMDGLFGEWDTQKQKFEGGLLNNVLPVLQSIAGTVLTYLPGLLENIVFNIVDTIGTALGVDTGWILDALNGIFDAIDSLAQSAKDMWAGFTESASFDGLISLFQQIQTVAGQVFDFITAHAGDIGSALGTAVDVISQVAQGVTDFFNGVSSTFEGSGFAGAFENVKTILQDVWTFVQDNILANADQIGAFVGTVATVIGDIALKATELFQIIQPYLPFIATFLGTFNVLLPLISTVSGIIGAISGAVTFFTTTVLPAIAAISSVGEAVSAVVAILGGPITIIAAIVAAIVAFVATNEEARNAVIGAIQAVVDFFMNLPATLAGIWEAIKSHTEQFINNTLVRWNEFKEGVHQTWENLKAMVIEKAKDMLIGVVERFQELRQSAQEKWESIKETISNAVEGMKERVSTGMQNVKDSIKSKWDEAVDWVRGIPDRIENALGNLSTLLWNAGTDVISGFWDGLTAKFTEVQDWVGGIGTWIAENKGPKQYDLGLLVKNGSWITTGLARGLEQGFANDVIPLVSGMAGEMQKAFGSTTFDVLPNLSAGITARDVINQPQAPSYSFEMHVENMTVNSRDDAEYMAQRVGELWQWQMEGSLV